MNRILALVVKELRTLLRDRQGRLLLIMPVLLQLVIFSFAATLEVKNNTLAILNEDSGGASVDLMQRLARTRAFTRVLRLENTSELRRAIDQQRALIALRFGPDFSRDIICGQPARVQAILDGRRSNSGQIALGYVNSIVNDWASERGSPKPVTTPETAGLVIRHWFNPNLDYIRHIIPSLVAIITTISTLVVTALSVAREREQGTFDQLLVSPLTPGMIMVGKTIPALIVACFQGSIIVAAGVCLFRIPFQGSLLMLYVSLFFYILAVSGFGLLISSIASTQQQAFLGAFSFLMPGVLLSGFPSPVENMPLWLQRIDWLNPLHHLIVIVKGVFLKDASWIVLLQSLWPLAVIAVMTLTTANIMFRRRLG